MRTFVASKSGGKLAELRAIFAGSRLEVESYPAYGEVEEVTASYLGNALLKARALAQQLARDGHRASAVLADDSGLEVDALQGRPGVFSARYAGEQASWPQRRAALTAELAGVPTRLRTARFVCVMTLIVPNQELCASIGVVEGIIGEAERGGHGFGYDPLFYYPPLERTFAELDFEEKNRVSHRARAARALLAGLPAHV